MAQGSQRAVLLRVSAPPARTGDRPRMASAAAEPGSPPRSQLAVPPESGGRGEGEECLQAGGWPEELEANAVSDLDRTGVEHPAVVEPSAVGSTSGRERPPGNCLAQSAGSAQRLGESPWVSAAKPRRQLRCCQNHLPGLS